MLPKKCVRSLLFPDRKVIAGSVSGIRCVSQETDNDLGVLCGDSSAYSGVKREDAPQQESRMMKRAVTSLITHLVAVGVGFAMGIYALPILIAPPAPDSGEIAQASVDRIFQGRFLRDRADSDALHWGEGEVSISANTITFSGKLAPGPDYRLYLSPEFVETEDDFNRLKSTMVQVGDVETFDNFIVNLPNGVDPSDYKAIIVWCESFGQYITSASYQERSG